MTVVEGEGVGVIDGVSHHALEFTVSETQLLHCGVCGVILFQEPCGRFQKSANK